MGIDRYDLYVDEYEDEPDLHYHECGDWVRFEDHEQVVAELDGVIEQRDALDVACLDMEREITRLRTELAAKSKDAERYEVIKRYVSPRDVFGSWWLSDNGWPQSLDDAIDKVLADDAMGEGNGR